MLVSMLHHVEDQAAAIAEAKRILRPRGRLALMVFTREDVEDLWLTDYFPSTRAWIVESHPSLAEQLAMLPGARRIEIVFRDLEDGASARSPRTPRSSPTRAGTARRATSSAFERDHAEELEAGLARLREDLAAGRAPTKPGRGTVLAWGG